MSKFRIESISKLTGALAVMVFCLPAYAEFDLGITEYSFGKPENLELLNSEAVQDLDVQTSSDAQQLSELLSDRIETTQAMHAGDEQVAEPVTDEF